MKIDINTHQNKHTEKKDKNCLYCLKEKAYRTKHNITNSADICEIAHKLTVQAIRKLNASRVSRLHKVDCGNKGFCKIHRNGELHYTDKAQDIFNNHYDEICELAGM